MLAFIVFVVAIAALVGQQIADLLQNSEDYVTRIVKFLNDTFGTHIDASQVHRRDPETARAPCSASSAARAAV